MMIVNKITFPEYSGMRCLMMPFIQGDKNSIPNEYKAYGNIIENNYIEEGEIGFLTIDESYVEGGKSQRGYNDTGIDRNVHIEVGRSKFGNRWGGNPPEAPPPTWGGKESTLLDDDTMVLIANNISDTCRLWNTIERSYTRDGDLSEYIDRYPEDEGMLMKSGEVAKISIFTPHECISQNTSGHRQFFRIVGKGVKGREDYFTINPLINH